MGKGYFYSDKNRGRDTTIEPAYFRGTGFEGQNTDPNIQQQIDTINQELEALRNTLNQVRTDVDNIQPYVLPQASATTLGGVKVGLGLNIDDGVLSTDGTTAPFDGNGEMVSTNLADAIKEANQNAGEEVVGETLVLN